MTIRIPDSTRPIRKRLRYSGFDYASDGAYFVTTCCYDRIPLFGGILEGEVVRSAAGQIVIDTWGNIALYHPEVVLDEYVLMPNHFHGILIIDRTNSQNNKVNSFGGRVSRDGRGPSPTVSLPYLMRELKSFSANKINRLLETRGDPVWQRGYWERVVRNEQELFRIREYIRNNPIQWECDRESLGQHLVGDGP